MIENGADSSLDDIDNQSAVSEIPAYKSANQELAGVLKNLRKLEQHIKSMASLLQCLCFPGGILNILSWHLQKDCVYSY